MGFALIKVLGRNKLDLAWRLCLAFGAVPGFKKFKLHQVIRNIEYVF